MSLRALVSGSLLIATLSAAGPIGPASAASFIPLPEQPIAPPSPRAGLGYGWQLDLQDGPTLLRSDATLRAYDNSSDTPGPARFTVFDPGATLSEPAYEHDPVHVSTDIPFAGNLTGLQAALEGDRYWRAGITAVGGANWSLEEHGAPGYALVARDDRESVVRNGELTHARNVDAVALLGTSLGVRGVLADPAHYSPEGAGGRVVDEQGRTVAQLRKLAPKAAAALADGSILVLGDTTYGRSLALVTPAGRVSYPRLLRPKGSQVGRPLQTASGLVVLVVDSSGPRTEVSFARLSNKGVLGRRHSIEKMGITWPPGCVAKRVSRSFNQPLVGPSGTVLFTMDCYPIGDDGVYGKLTTVIVELTVGLDFRRVVAAETQAVPTTRSPFRGIGTLPNGRLYVSHSDSSIASIVLPDALPVTQGTLGAVTARGTDQAIVRVSCRRPYGAVCSGRVEVTAPGGSYFGWAPYSLPGRPGRAQAEIDLTVQRSAIGTALSPTVGRDAQATLLPLPARFERGSPAPPTP